MITKKIFTKDAATTERDATTAATANTMENITATVKDTATGSTTVIVKEKDIIVTEEKAAANATAKAAGAANVKTPAENAKIRESRLTED